MFILFSFFFWWGAEGVSVCPRTALDYVPRGWVRELHLVSDAHLFILQIHASSFEADQGGEMALLFSVWRGVRRLSMG
jgi:hypothetical protein